MPEQVTEVSVADLRAALAAVLNKAIRGEIVFVTSRGRRIAAIVPVTDGEALLEYRN